MFGHVLSASRALTRGFTVSAASIEPTSNQVFGFGRGKAGRLGLGLNRTNQSKPRAISALDGQGVVQISCGGEHSAAVTLGGELFAWGDNRFGQLGNTKFGSWLQPGSGTPARVHLPDAAAAVACGASHTMVITRGGAIYGFGNGAQGRLGTGTDAHSALFTLVTALKGVRTTKLACGGNFTAALTADGDLFTWGGNEHGQLGHGTRFDQFVPKRVDALAGTPIVDFACGGAHMVAVTAEGAVYVWGRGEDGTLGQGLLRRGDRLFPQKVKFFDQKPVRQVSAGAEHTAAITRQGEVFTWGDGFYGQLGHGSRRNMYAPRRVEELVPLEVARVVCGGFHTAALTVDGQVFLFGQGSFGQLGCGFWGAVAEPTRPTVQRPLFVRDAALGAEHSLLLAFDRTLVEPDSAAPAKRGLLSRLFGSRGRTAGSTDTVQTSADSSTSATSSSSSNSSTTSSKNSSTPSATVLERRESAPASASVAAGSSPIASPSPAQAPASEAAKSS